MTRDTDLGGGAFSVGDTLKLPKRGALVVNDKAENTDYTAQNPTASTVDLVLNKHKEVTFIIESRALSEVNQDVIAGYVEDAAIALAEQIDIDIAALYADIAGGNTITGGATLQDTDILTARKLLVDNKVPAGMKKFGIISTSQSAALLGLDPFVRYDALGVSNNISDATLGDGAVTMPGSLGRLYGFEISESQLVPVSGTTKNLFFAQDAFLFASRPLENPESMGGAGVQSSVISDPDSGISLRLLRSYQHLKGGHAITLDCLYGVKGMRLEHAVLATTTS